MKAMLVLEDGSVFQGISTGVPGERIGEVVLNTAVVGYQEIMTDPANAGRILVLTYPLIGNYGVAKQFYESGRCWISALVVKESSRMCSNWQADNNLSGFLEKEKLVAISEVDTRTLAVKIRDCGEMLGIVSSKEMKKSALLKKLKDHKRKNKKDFIGNVSVKRIKQIKGSPSEPRIAIIDLGILNSFIEQLKNLGCSLTLLPHSTGADRILGLKPDGLIISSGPEEDETIPAIAEVVQKLLGKIPILGISTGAQIIYLALGGKLKKMKVGHHGLNYPVRPTHSYKGNITIQNHSYVMDESSHPRLCPPTSRGRIKEGDNLLKSSGVKITLRNVNDNSIEEIESTHLRLIACQYYPAASGTGEANEVFTRFLEMVENAKT